VFTRYGSGGSLGRRTEEGFECYKQMGPTDPGSLHISGDSAAHRRVSGGMNVARPFKAGMRWRTHPRRASDE
jgi:hypothetical protein